MEVNEASEVGNIAKDDTSQNTSIFYEEQKKQIIMNEVEYMLRVMSVLHSKNS